MIYGEVLRSGLKLLKWRWGSWLIDDNLMKGKAWGKLCTGRKVWSEEKVWRKEKQVRWNFFQCLRVLWLVRTYASAATKCGHIPHQVRASNCHFQHRVSWSCWVAEGAALPVVVPPTSSGPAALVTDESVQAVDIVWSLIVQKRKKPLCGIPLPKAIKDLVNWKSTLQNEILGG